MINLPKKAAQRLLFAFDCHATGVKHRNMGEISTANVWFEMRDDHLSELGLPDWSELNQIGGFSRVKRDDTRAA